MELELKHVKGYLDTGLKGQTNFLGEKNIYTISTDNVRSCFYPNNSIKPILYPLSYLTKEIEVNGEKIVPLYRLTKEDKAFTTDFINTFGYEELKVSVYELLLEWHFDIYGLIEKGLAIDINKL